MNIAISGASGFIGKKLTEKFEELKWRVILINRIDFERGTDFLSKKINDADVVINLAGAPITKRWTKIYKKLLYDSRINSTRILVNAINKLQKKPSLFISASAIGIYDDVHIHTEASKMYADHYLAHICKDWESEALKAQTHTIIFRFSVVLDKYDGAFPKMYLPFRLGIGGKIGNGKQWFSWVHIDDLVNAYLFAVENNCKSEVYNISSPQVITNEDFTKTLAKKIRRIAIFHVPRFIFKILYGEASIVLIKGQNAKPENLISEGFVFRFPTLNSALTKLV